MSRFLLILILNLTLTSGLRSADKCPELFASEESPVDAALHEKILGYEQLVLPFLQQYRERLGIYQDPFDMAFTPEVGEKIFQRLSIRRQGNVWIESPLFHINEGLKKVFVSNTGFDEELVKTVLADAEDLLQKPKAARADLQSNLLALKYTMEYLKRYKIPEKVVDIEGEEVKEEKEKQKPTQDQDKQTAEEEQDSPPEYPELPEEYKPSTNGDLSKGGGKQKKHRIAETNFSTALFAQRYFSEIVRRAKHPFRQSSLTGLSAQQPGRYRDTGKEEIVRTFGKREVSLFIPPLFKPLQPSDPRAVIKRLDTGGYVLQLKEDLADIRIPLTEDNNIVMLPHILELYTRPVGFALEEWPDEVKAAILHKYSAEDGKKDPLKVARAISQHINKDYIYSMGPRPETDPIDALKAGKFRCDMAAYVMVGLLRDVYGIPSRVVGGYRGKIFQGGKDGRSYLVIPGEAHAWVEVFYNGEWHLFDPTPVKKDKKQEGDGDKEYQDIQLDDIEGAGEEEEGADESSQRSKPSDSAPEKGKDHKQRLDEDTERRTDEVKTKDGKGEEKEESESESKGGDELSIEDLVDQLELGSLTLEPTEDRNALVERAVRVTLQAALEPTQRGSEIQNRLNQISSLMRRFHTPALKAIYQKAQSAHSNEHPDLKEWVEQVVRRMANQEVNKTYHEVHKIHLALHTYSQVLDHQGRIQPPIDLLLTLEDVLRQLHELAHPDSQDIGLVQDLIKNFPSVTRQLLKDDYDLSIVGPNAPTRNVAQKLKKGKLNDLRLMSILTPLTDFILNSTPRPENIEVKTWQRDARRPRGQDLLPLQRFSDLARAIWTQPGKTIEENIKEGTAFVPVRRQRILIPAGYGKEEAERITIVAFDTSGSMAGDPGRFQAALIAAFTAVAGSDLAPSGRPRHRVLLVPFDGEPGTPISVSNPQEAMDVIRHFHKKLANTGGSTDIQKAMMQIFSLIAEAQNRTGEPLAAANAIVMTDGEAQIDAQELLKARQAIDRTTPIQTMFIAINKTNEELMRFAMDSHSMGAERGFYREFTPEHISDILKEADNLDLEGRNDFFSDKNANELPRKVYDAMDHALRMAAKFSDHIYYGSQHLSAREHLENLEKIKWLDIPQMDRPLEQWLIKVRRLVLHPIFKDRRILERVVDDLLTHFESLTGVATQGLSNHEQEHLRHLVRYAAGLEDSGW